MCILFKYSPPLKTGHILFFIIFRLDVLWIHLIVLCNERNLENQCSIRNCFPPTVRWILEIVQPSMCLQLLREVLHFMKKNVIYFHVFFYSTLFSFRIFIFIFNRIHAAVPGIYTSSFMNQEWILFQVD